jgi:hypothetical protein
MWVSKEIQNTDIIAYLRKNMQKHLDNACKDFEKFRRHPASNDYIVRIARYALSVGDKERARKYFDDFVHSKISIYHYAVWIQKYYKELKNEFQRQCT